jgi:hypothetical protein
LFLYGLTLNYLERRLGNEFPRNDKYFMVYFPYMKIRDSSAVQRWATGWPIRGSSPGRGWKFFSSLSRPDRFWDPLSLLSSGYHGLFTWRLGGQGVELTTSSSVEVNNVWSYTSTPPILFHGVLLSYSTGTTLPLPLYPYVCFTNFTYVARCA